MGNYILIKNDELYHFGILGMKWGIRRYQNEDGSLTDAGRKHRDKLVKKLKKHDSENYRGAFETDLMFDKVINEFDKDFTKRNNGESLYGAKRKLSRTMDEISAGAQDYAKKTTGASNAVDALFSGKDIQKTVEAGEFYTAKEYMDKDVIKLIEDYGETSKKYEKELRTFMSQYLGEEGAKESMDKLALTVDLNTGKVKPQTLAEKASIYTLKIQGGNVGNAKAGKGLKIQYKKTTPKDYKSPNNGKYDDKFLESIKGTKIQKDKNTYAIDKEYELYLTNPDKYYNNRAKYLE
jgi:hypothetical protein